jgi:hypothetical protein
MAPTIALWFRRRFNLAPLDPRFLELTPEDIAAEYWAHRFADKPAGEEFEDDAFDADAIAQAMADGADWEAV